MDFRNIEESREDNQETFHYYFNHEERIKKAPQNVQDFYNGTGPTPPKGILKSLVATKANRFGLFSILIFCAFIYAYSLVSEKPNKKNIGGIQMSLAAFSFADEIFISVTANEMTEKEKKDEPFEAKIIKIKFQTIDNAGEIIGETDIEETYYGDELILRTKFSDYDIVKAQAKVSFNDDIKTLVTQIEKR